MSITFAKAYVANGKTYATLKDAQFAELSALFALKGDQTPWNESGIAGIILDNADLVLDILTTKDNSRPKARAVNGGRKPRKPKTNAGLPSYQETRREDGVTP